ncbi:ArnT family glycosyltransferase [Butyrivibrio sp. M55]|uniref:ArnT family glycosyltransferase n=1 Tax=Butyrivibrio sp. M55 TaxID=1855323 RepID=UPI0008F29400|nr:glycosyltransferase family 39 protein [Butyrivibrio sp. M55]SFU82444.1 Dolichyl-phosphate-mannose-protein mannosyltransferase [Butyrivibrio sp. M55]
MRIIDYYNYIATAACAFIGAAAVLIYKKGKNTDLDTDKNTADISAKTAHIILTGIILFAAAVRLIGLGSVPAGLQQDEASLGYDAFAIAKYGVDRNGFAYPIYPITWGCGGGSPLMIYINVLTIKLFGTGVVKLRLLPAILGIATVYIFYLILKEIILSYKKSLFGATFLALCPWHIILSRWSLDSNIMPFTLGLSVYLFILGIKTGKTLIYCLSAAAYAMCMYSYGSATIVVPIHLILISIYCLRKKVLSVKQLILAVLTFVIVFSPLLVFYAVNYLGLPEIVTDSFSFNKFTASRSDEVFIRFDSSLPRELWENIRQLIITLTIGDNDEMLCHFIPGYATLFEFTFPITFLGIFLGKRAFLKCEDTKENSERAIDDDKRSAMDAVFVTLLISCVLLAVGIRADVSRMVMIFLPLVYFLVKGISFIWDRRAACAYAVMAVVVLAAGLFIKDYFTGFNDKTANLFMPGYGEAAKRAYEIAGDDTEIYSTYENLSAPFVIALYYTDYNPVKFADTVVYKDETDEFRVAESFGNFKFGLPEDYASYAGKDAVLILSSSELDTIDGATDCTVENFGRYSVVYGSGE